MESPDGQVFLLSWNLLAPIFTRTNQEFASFTHVRNDEYLEWENRRNKILQILLQANADVVTLQEVQFERGADGKFELPGWLRLGLGEYGNFIPGWDQDEWDHQAERNFKVLNKAECTGCAILYRKTKFVLAGSVTSSRGMVAYLKLVDGVPHGGEEIAVGCVHLEGHPDLVDMRARQLRSVVKSARKREGAHVIVCGDFNAGMKEVAMHNAEHALARVPTGPSWSCGAFCQSIDHIFFADASLQVQRVYEPFDAVAAGKEGYPNALVPSDHHPIGAVFSISGPAPRQEPLRKPSADHVSQERKQEIAASWDTQLAQFGRPVPNPKGKPNAEQMEILKAFAEVKKRWLAQFDDEDEVVFAKSVLQPPKK